MKTSFDSLAEFITLRLHLAVVDGLLAPMNLRALKDGSFSTENSDMPGMSMSRGLIK